MDYDTIRARFETALGNDFLQYSQEVNAQGEVEHLLQCHSGRYCARTAQGESPVAAILVEVNAKRQRDRAYREHFNDRSIYSMRQR